MSDYASVEDLIGANPAAIAATAMEGVDYTLPSGRVVRIRALTRRESLAVGHAGRQIEDPAESIAAFERATIRIGLLAPALTDEQLDAWLSLPGESGDINALSGRISHISGNTREAHKAIYKSDGERSVVGVGSEDSAGES